MNYLKNTFKIVKKNLILILPLFILTVITRYLHTYTFTEEYVKNLLFPPNTAPLAFSKFSNIADALISFLIKGGFIPLLLMFAVIPGTYGMVNKAVDNEKVSLIDFIPSVKSYFSKYLSITITRLIIWVVYAFASLMFVIFSMLFLFIPENIHIPIVISVIGIILLIALFIHICQCLWITIVVRENTNTEHGLRKSFKIVYHAFAFFACVFISSKILGLALEVLLYKLVNIPVIRPVLMGIIPAFVQFMLITFYLVVYKEKSRPKYAD